MGAAWSGGEGETPSGVVELVVRGEPLDDALVLCRKARALLEQDTQDTQDQRPDPALGETPVLAVFRVEARYLSLASPVFRAMLAGQFAEEESIEVMEGTTPEAFAAFLEHTAASLCGGGVPLTEELVLQLLPLADYYAIDPLIERICDWVQRHATLRAVEAVEALSAGSFPVCWSRTAIKALAVPLLIARSNEHKALSSPAHRLAIENRAHQERRRSQKAHLFRREAQTQAQALGVLRGSTVAAVMAEAMETPLVLPVHAG